MACKHVVDRLLRNWLMQMIPIGDLDRSNNLAGGPIRSAPVHGFAPFDDIVHRPNSLFDRRCSIRAMAIDQVYVFELETLERSVNSFDQALAIEGAFLVYAILNAPIEFSGDQITTAPPT